MELLIINLFIIMLKSTLFAGALILAGSAAHAGVYANVESNSSFSDSDYTSTLLETHVGYESDLGNDASWYIQGGPAIGFPDGEDATGAVSGKIGATTNLSEDLSAYGEVAAFTADDWDFDSISVGVKAGLKYTF